MIEREPSSIEEAVVEKIRSRGRAGLRKYGTDLDRRDLGMPVWVQHAQDEVLDAAQYLEVLLRFSRLIPDARRLLGVVAASGSSPAASRWVAEFDALFADTAASRPAPPHARPQ